MRRLLVWCVLCAAVSQVTSAAPLAVHLYSSLASPQPVGVVIGLSPGTENVSKGMLVFRYAVSVNGGPFRMVRDFSQQRDFTWAPELFEHKAVIRLTVRNNESKEIAEDQAGFQFVSRVKGNAAVVTPTAHPLIALFSAPPCAEGSQFRVAFRPEGEETVMRTPAQACRASISNNVLVAGMRADSDYRMRAEILSGGSSKAGAWMPFHTGLTDGNLTPVRVTVPRPKGSPVVNPVVIYSAGSLTRDKRGLATDLEGRVIWYLASYDGITRVLPGGHFLTGGNGLNNVNDTREEQVIRELDLAGNIVRETNAGRIGEQLGRFGIHSDCRAGGQECVSGLHHEVIRIPNGHTLAVAGLERMMPAGTQGSTEPVDILGDLVVDLDEDFQVAGVWNSFDHLDVQRKSYKDAKCRTGGGGCPPVLLKPTANGWLHTNSLNYIPSTGDLLLSVPEQEWVIKVDWKNGKGTGNVLWRLGKGGDFKVESEDPNPWFSYAHDVGYEPAGSNTITLMDNGSVYRRTDPKFQGRAQTWQLDEEKKVAKLVYNASLGGPTSCCGSMQILKNGSYNSAVGWVDPLSPRALNVETDKNGKIVHAFEVTGGLVYRTFRVDDLYSAPLK